MPRRKGGMPRKIKLEAMSKETLPKKPLALSERVPNARALVPKMPKDGEIGKPPHIPAGRVRLLRVEQPPKPPKMRGDKVKVEKPPKPKASKK